MILLPDRQEDSAGSEITRTVSAGRYLPSTTVSAGSKRPRTVSAEAKYDGQSLQEALISGLVYTLCLSNHPRKVLLKVGLNRQDPLAEEEGWLRVKRSNTELIFNVRILCEKHV